jgi:hypothetical protein
MALSPSYTFGQKIGELLEEMLRPLLAEAGKKHGLYLDYKHERPARQNKKKVAWQDNKGNTHDLDYVLESGGSELVKGSPKAFIECAWRSYTKHSRNKAQEMQGAIIPLAQTYSQHHPFLGVVLAGVFTEGSLKQLRSIGFAILFFPQESIVSAFVKAGIDAYFDEDTPDADVQKKLEAYQRLTRAKKSKIIAELKRIQEEDIRSFLGSLEASLTRWLTRISVVALHGLAQEVSSVAEAIELVEQYQEGRSTTGFVRYELIARYSNGDKIIGDFENKRDAIQFLSGLR